MKNEELRKKVLETMQSDNCCELYENLAEACFDSINSDDEPYRGIAGKPIA